MNLMAKPLELGARALENASGALIIPALPPNSKLIQNYQFRGFMASIYRKKPIKGGIRTYVRVWFPQTQYFEENLDIILKVKGKPKDPKIALLSALRELKLDSEAEEIEGGLVPCH